MSAKRKFDPYAELGVPRDAGPDEVQHAFRDVVKKYHPDAGKHADRDKFEQAKRAQLILLDPERRRKFDETGDADDPQINGPDHGALTMIGQLLTQILADDDVDPLKHDLVEAMTGALNADEQKAAKGLAKVERSLARLGRMRRRFKRRDGADNLIERILDFNEGQLRELVVKQREISAHRRRAVEILAEFSFDKERQEQFVQSFATAGTASW